MKLRDTLPSTRFSLIAAALALSGGLIYAADYLTKPAHAAPAPQSVVVASQTAPQSDWQETLREIQGQNPANQAPQPPSADHVNALLNAAQSNNLTDTVARTLFVNLSDAKAQGLGNDTPTQDELVAQAVSQISARPQETTYTTANLTLSSNTTAAQTTFGNAFMAAVAAHPEASYDATIYTIGTSTDNGDPKRLAPLAAIGKGYIALAKDLSATPVPPTLAPLHVQIVNNIERMGELFPDMQQIYSDPLRGLAAFQLYDALNQETLRLFINIAQDFSQDGILFKSTDPGAAWSALVQ